MNNTRKIKRGSDIVEIYTTTNLAYNGYQSLHIITRSLEYNRRWTPSFTSHLERSPAEPSDESSSTILYSCIRVYLGARIVSFPLHSSATKL
jgi:hypothetical protein